MEGETLLTKNFQGCRPTWIFKKWEGGGEWRCKTPKIGGGGEWMTPKMGWGDKL